MSLFSTFGLAHPAWFGGDTAAVEPVRRAMLAVLGEPVPRGCVLLHSRIQYAADLQRLWYLRAPLMAALAELHGEARAAQELERITGLFEDHLPRGLATAVARRRSA